MIEHLVERSVRAGEAPTQRTVQVGRSQGTVRLLTGWENVGNRAGHKLTLQAEQWLGEAFLLNRAAQHPQVTFYAALNHSEFGLTPYVGLFGSLRARDRVEIVIDLAIPELRTAG